MPSRTLMLSCMVIFHCDEDWFAMIKPIKPNIGLWISSEPSPETLQNRLKFCWLKVICCICQSNNLEREIKQKTGGESRGLAKNLRGSWPTHPLLEPPLWRYHCSVTLLDNGEVVMRISHLLFHIITSQGNDNASQNESKWKFQWRKRWTVLFIQSE